ncbi:MAG TPA: complex I NDUFA9 subunit family protein, partial [Gemmatimonadaceae bacterium]|nr:complex I NDUFA9 subunit family protein [Gemmatimonadaceae bacterium]
MKIFVTGGTGVVGQAAVTALVEAGHEVRLFSRHADEEVRAWPRGVEARAGSVADPADLRGAADGCDVVLHLVAVVRESPPEATFEKVNVEGTRNVVAEAERAGVRRLVYVSSLGADRGKSEYHRSKKAGEEIARRFSREWVVVRPGNVYGPGDEVISLLLKMIRILPAVPVIDGGEHEFQPVWVGDVAQALVGAVERPDVVGQSFDMTGADLTCMNDLIDRFAEITDRRVLRVPMPGWVASFGAGLGDKLGLNTPITVGQIQMLEERNVIEDPADNALTSVFGVEPTPLDEGLRKLADALPEQLPDEGTGGLKRRLVWADIVGTRLTADQLFERFRRHFSEITPWHMEVGAEPGTPTEPREGETLTMHLPVRGNIQVRIEELTPRCMTLVTLAGHPLAGAVRFRCEPRDAAVGGGLRFEVLVHDRASNIADWLVMSTVGGQIQRMTWKSIVEEVVRESGGEAPDGVRHESDTLRGAEAKKVEEWLDGLV